MSLTVSQPSRVSGCLPLLVQLLHGSDTDNNLLGRTRGSKAARARAAAALHNIVHSHPDDKRGRREARVLRLLEQIRAHWDQLRQEGDDGESAAGAGQSPLVSIRELRSESEMCHYSTSHRQLSRYCSNPQHNLSSDYMYQYGNNCQVG